MMELNTPVLGANTMQKFINDFLFGLALGIGFIVAANVLAFIISMLGGHPVQLHQ
jgi:hypothetical protein